MPIEQAEAQPTTPEWLHVDPVRERLLLATETVGLGYFHVRPEDPAFEGAGQAHTLLLAIPRQPVWIERERACFAAVPGTCVLHDVGRSYRRRPLSAAGDRSLWIAVAPDLAEDLRARCGGFLSRRDPCGIQRLSAAAHREVLELEILASTAPERIAPIRGELERRTLALVMEVLSCPPLPAGASRSRRLVEDAKAYMVARLDQPPSLGDVAQALDTSPSHLCRLFSRHERLPAHRWRAEHRLHVALDRLAECASLTDLALELGFSSHSHFTSAFRRRVGQTPSRLRSRLRGLRERTL